MSGIIRSSDSMGSHIVITGLRGWTGSSNVGR